MKRSEEKDHVPPPLLTSHDLQRLYKRRNLRPVLAIFRIYGSVTIAIVLGIILPPLFLIFIIPTIAALQHAISILLHEAVHSLLFKSRRTNEVVGNIISYPIGFSLSYREIHFPHHAHLGTPGEDPDLHNYEEFPTTWPGLARKLLLDFSGISAIIQFLSKNTLTHTEKKTPMIHLAGILGAQLIIFSFFFISGHPWHYLILWIIPLVTITKGLAQLRNLAEHLTRPERAPYGAQRIRTFKSSLIERFFLAPLNFNYHAEHHWYPMIPYYNLPEAREILQKQEGFSLHAKWCKSYMSALKEAVQPHKTQ